METDFWIALGIGFLILRWIVAMIEAETQDYPYDDDL
jgi:hypothetical protein